VPPDRCPYCELPFGPDRPSTKDHVFVESLGGRVQLQACKPCNDVIGHDIEGRLQRPGQFLNRRHLRGNLRETGDPVEYDLNEQRLRFSKPVTVTEAEGVRTYQLRGDEADVRRALKQMRKNGRLSELPIEELMKSGRRQTVEPPWIETKVTLDLALADRLAAKVALGAGVLADESFVASSLAATLRLILWGKAEVVRHLDLEALERYDELLNAHLDGTIESIRPIAGQPDSRAIFLPQSRGVAVFVFVADLPLGFSGMLVDGTWPFARGLGVVVLDSAAGLRVRRLEPELAHALATMQDFAPPAGPI
jgi:hypothetical protein